MGTKEDSLKHKNDKPTAKVEKRTLTAVPTIQKKEQGKHDHSNIKQIFVLSFDALRERKARSILTILMVVAGGGLMVALNGMSAGVASLINKQLSILAPNVLFVSPGQINFRGGPSPPSTLIFNSQVVDRIKSLPYVQEVIPTIQGQFQLNAQGNMLTTPVLAMDTSKLRLISPSLELVPGSSIQKNNPSGMIVGDTIANPPGKPNFVLVGQSIKATYSYADPSTGKLQQKSRSFAISAIMEPTGNAFIDKSVIINLPTGDSLFKKGGKYDQMAVLALSGDFVNAVQQEITNVYGPDNIGVTTPKAIIKTIQGAQGGNSSFQTGIAFITLLVGAVGIITTLYTSVNERIKEIGTMKAIGAKNRFILALFLSEALIIGLIGSTLGLFTGVAGAYMLTSGIFGGGSGGSPGSGGGGGGGSAHFAPIFYPNDLLNVWLLSLLLSLAAGVYPAWKASRLSPLEALRRYYFIAAALATAVAGIVHLYIPFGFPMVFENPAVAVFFLGSGIAQVFWILPMLKRWGKPWYYIGIIGNVGFIVLYIITLFPGNPINGRGGTVDLTAAICESGQIAYIAITAIILTKERRAIRVSQRQ